MSSSLFLVSAAKLLVDVALFSLIGQALMFVFAGSRRQQNFVYQLFGILTRPVFAVVRLVTPKFVGEQFHGLIAFSLVFWLWLGLIVAKCYFCVTTAGSCERGCTLLLAILGYVPS